MLNQVKIITDSNSGLLQQEAEELGIFVIPMPFTINGKEYLEEITLSQEEFYQLLLEDTNISTSQPSQYYLETLWKEQLKENESIVYIPMSSGLSATCESALALAEKFDGRVQVVDNLRISVTQKESVYEAIELAKRGKSALEIKTYLEETKHKSSIYIMLETLKYLKKGGRIKPAAAALATMLQIKPILFSRGDKFDKFSTTLTTVHGKRKMIQKIREELATDFLDDYEKGNMVVSVAHTNNLAAALKFKEEIIAAFPKLTFRFVDALSLSVTCHIGPGSLAIAITVNNYLNTKIE